MCVLSQSYQGLHGTNSNNTLQQHTLLCTVYLWLQFQPQVLCELLSAFHLWILMFLPVLFSIFAQAQLGRMRFRSFHSLDFYLKMHWVIVLLDVKALNSQKYPQCFWLYPYFSQVWPVFQSLINYNPEHGATTTMLYCGNGVLWVSIVEFMPNVSLRANASMLYFGLSIPKKLFFQHMISYPSCDPIKLLQSYIWPLCFFSD